MIIIYLFFLILLILINNNYYFNTITHFKYHLYFINVLLFIVLNQKGILNLKNIVSINISEKIYKNIFILWKSIHIIATVYLHNIGWLFSIFRKFNKFFNFALYIFTYYQEKKFRKWQEFESVKIGRAHVWTPVT